MRDKVMISVIMPVYNGQDWLHDSIGSILSQDFSNYEIIIVNDGSTDNSAEILNEYAANHSNIRVFNNKNSGPGNSLNFGIQQAQGKYLCFIDQDDMYDSKYLSSMYAAIEKSDADLCMCYGRTFENATGHTERLRFPYIETGIISDKYGLLDCFYPQWTKIIKRDFILQHDIKFPLRHNPVHDVPFHILTVYFAKKIFILNAELYRHRVHSGQITHNLISFAKKGNIISLQDIESYYKTHPSAGRELMQFALGLMNFRGNFWQKLTIKRFRLKYNLKSEIIRIFYKKSYDDKFCRTRILC
ncbi:MAG: glycosyltransferase, partial [Alphaproteobacteria bacterium]|nr:glycosyltransferase [Alphaproteobacteria bacterium]